uniref:O-succinylbenzoic acid-CoA ligase n=1 Tax=Cyanidium sp. THAL103 TaxID=3027999 RepID=A0A9Y1MY84_9RHOD|nr:O-succinylbenzoic acid-CoA ligase [Cyanidium sp. THAL103]
MLFRNYKINKISNKIDTNINLVKFVLLNPFYFYSVMVGKNILFISPDKVFTYYELAYLIDYLRYYLIDYHVVDSYGLLIVFTNNPITYISLSISSILSKNVLILINPKMNLDSLVEIINKRQPSLIILDKQLKIDSINFYKIRTFRWQEFKNNTNLDLISCIINKPNIYDLNISNISNVSNIFFSSGTTQIPKLCSHSFFNKILSAISINKYNKITSCSKFFLILPIHYVGGLNVIIRSIIATSSILLIPRNHQFNFVSYFKVATCNLYFLSIVNTQIYRLKYFRLGWVIFNNISFLMIGGGSKNKKLLEDFKILKKYSNLNSYSLTENFAQLFLSYENPKSFSIVLPYRQLKIAFNNEVNIRSKTLLLNNQIFNNNNSSYIIRYNVNSWFKTADLISIKITNHLIIVGRIDSIFIRSGKKILPYEIEKKLNLIPNVLYSKVISIPNDHFDNEIVAFLKYNNVANFDEHQVRIFLNKLLDKNKIPNKILLLHDNLPNFNVTNKLDKQFLCDYYLFNKLHKT